MGNVNAVQSLAWPVGLILRPGNLLPRKSANIGSAIFLLKFLGVLRVECIPYISEIQNTDFVDALMIICVTRCHA